MVTENDWDEFVGEYASDGVYWFFPKATTVDGLEFREKFRVFDLFEGEIWDHATQDQIQTELRAEGLSEAGAAFPRMIKRVFEVLGLALVENDLPIIITATGKAFLEETSGESATLNSVVWRYQLPNPVNSSNATRGIEVHPHSYLVETALRSDGYVTAEEYSLFVARSKFAGLVDLSVDRIAGWRELSYAKRSSILTHLSGSTYSRVLGNHSYAFAFHNCDELVTKPPGELRILPASTAFAWRRLEAFKRRAPIYSFKSERRYIEFISAKPDDLTPVEEVDFYVDISDVENAVKAFEKLPEDFKKGKSKEEFEREQFLEKDLEDFLENNMDLIEDDLTLVKRQFQTSVGPADLVGLASNGDLVVIELKKGRASDKVFGQVSRYIGSFMSDPEYDGKTVRGYIIGREIDDKLHLAAMVAREGTLGFKNFRFVDESTTANWIVLEEAAR